MFRLLGNSESGFGGRKNLLDVECVNLGPGGYERGIQFSQLFVTPADIHALPLCISDYLLGAVPGLLQIADRIVDAADDLFGLRSVIPVAAAANASRLQADHFVGGSQYQVVLMAGVAVAVFAEAEDPGLRACHVVGVALDVADAADLGDPAAAERSGRCGAVVAVAVVAGGRVELPLVLQHESVNVSFVLVIAGSALHELYVAISKG